MTPDDVPFLRREGDEVVGVRAVAPPSIWGGALDGGPGMRRSERRSHFKGAFWDSGLPIRQQHSAMMGRPVQ